MKMMLPLFATGLHIGGGFFEVCGAFLVATRFANIDEGPLKLLNLLVRVSLGDGDAAEKMSIAARATRDDTPDRIEDIGRGLACVLVGFMLEVAGWILTLISHFA